MSQDLPKPESAQDLFQVIVAAIGYTEGNLIHAYSAAFHRVPRLYRELDPAAFLASPEIREIVHVLVHLLEARTSLRPGQVTQEGTLRDSLKRYRQSWAD